MNTSLARVSPFYHRLQPQIYWRFLSGVMPGGNLRRREATILDLISNRAADRAKTLEEWVAYARDTPVSGSNVLRQLVAAMRYLGPRERPAVPLLVLSGMGDRLVSPLCSARIAGRWSLPLRSHPIAGHDLTLDAADWVCEQVGLWLQGTDTSPGGSDLAAR
jgi:pimeloyl-ACP methyl ester carboxylesterase